MRAALLENFPDHKEPAPLDRGACVRLSRHRRPKPPWYAMEWRLAAFAVQRHGGVDPLAHCINKIRVRHVHGEPVHTCLAPSSNLHKYLPIRMSSLRSARHTRHGQSGNGGDPPGVQPGAKPGMGC